MKPEQQRIAIAEACKWTEVVRPNYPNDLNAMHEAEKTLSLSEKRQYFYHLFGRQRLDDAELWKAVHATAMQRAEAFLKVKGLWKP